MWALKQKIGREESASRRTGGGNSNFSLEGQACVNTQRHEFAWTEKPIMVVRSKKSCKDKIEEKGRIIVTLKKNGYFAVGSVQTQKHTK